MVLPVPVALLVLVAVVRDTDDAALQKKRMKYM
jgi:hypothetical protein